MVNAWGIAFNPAGYVWVASTGTHTSTLYGANYIYATDFANNRIYVIFAKHAGNFEELKPGSGVLDVFDTAGKLIKQLVVGGTLNAPWGVAMAPASFGTYSGKLLVGNFGDGLVQAYDPNTGASAGLLKKADGSNIAIDGLWGLAFGNGVQGPADIAKPSCLLS